MNQPPTSIYYRGSGRVSPLVLPSFVLLGIPVTVIAAAIYEVFIRYNPFIYFSFIGTLVFGLVIALVSEAVTHRGKSRSSTFDLLVALVLALFGLWVSWLFWVWLMLGRTQVEQLLTATPAQWLDFLSWLSHNLNETVARYAGAGSKSQPATPTELALQWSAEAVLIVGVTLLVVRASRREHVFSEQTGRWAAQQFKGEMEAINASPEQLRQAFEAGDFSSLMSIRRSIAPDSNSGIREWESLSLELIADDDDPGSCVMHLDTVKNRFNSKGKRESSRRVVVENLLLPKPVYDALLSRVNTDAKSEVT